MAHACLNVRNFLRDTLQLDAPWPLCVAAVSGGADSTALALCLHLLQVPFVVAHLDHNLRPESAAEARQVAALSAALGVKCIIERADVAALASEQRIGIEDAGRQCRYAMLERARCTCGAEWIVTGHHLDDLSEDVLLRLIRGSGWPGLAGMPARDDARHLLRPLLHTPRAELESWLRLLNLPWIEDASNSQRTVRRNRIRHDLLPLIRAENPAFDQAVRRLWELARRDDAYWSIHASLPDPEETDETVGEQSFISLAREHLNSLEPAARLRLYMACVRRFAGSQARADALLQLDDLWQQGRTGAVVHLPGLVVRILRQGIVFARSQGG